MQSRRARGIRVYPFEKVIWTLTRGLLAALLLASGLAKLMSPYDISFAVSREIYFGTAGVECGLAILLFTRASIVAACGAVVLALAGIGFALLDRDPWRSCGCLGRWTVHLTRGGVIAVASAIGGLGAVLLLHQLTDAREGA